MKAVLCILIVSLISPGAVSVEDAHKQAVPPKWDLKFKTGSFQLKKEQRLKGTFLPETAGMQETNAIARISVDRLRAIYFDERAEKDSDLLQRMPRSGCAYAQHLMPTSDSAAASEVLSIWVASSGVISRAAQHLSMRYPVRLVWTNDGAENELTVTVDRCEYAAFLANMRRLAGQRWQEVEHPLLK